MGEERSLFSKEALSNSCWNFSNNHKVPSPKNKHKKNHISLSFLVPTKIKITEQSKEKELNYRWQKENINNISMYVCMYVYTHRER